VWCAMRSWRRRLLCWTSCCFFFSSRRRHTRSLRDWSSDVCSSDLIVRILKDTRTDVVVSYLPVGSEQATKWYVEQVLEAGCGFRSEERRVGKECRSRGWPCPGKKKVCGLVRERAAVVSKRVHQHYR